MEDRLHHTVGIKNLPMISLRLMVVHLCTLYPGGLNECTSINRYLGHLIPEFVY